MSAGSPWRFARILIIGPLILLPPLSPASDAALTWMSTFNGEYPEMRHFSQFVKPGAKRVLTIGPWDDKIAFVNPDGSTAIVTSNFARNPQEVVFTVTGRPDGTLEATQPGGSVNTFLVPPKS